MVPLTVHRKGTKRLGVNTWDIDAFAVAIGDGCAATMDDRPTRPELERSCIDRPAPAEGSDSSPRRGATLGATTGSRSAAIVAPQPGAGHRRPGKTSASMTAWASPSVMAWLSRNPVTIIAR